MAVFHSEAPAMDRVLYKQAILFVIAMESKIELLELTYGLWKNALIDRPTSKSGYHFQLNA